MKYFKHSKIYILYALLLTGTAGSYSYNRWGGEEPDIAEKVDVKTIRQNPASFRSHYMPRMIYMRGK